MAKRRGGGGEAAPGDKAGGIDPEKWEAVKGL